MDQRKGLPRGLQLGLGERLRAHYRDVFQSIPPNLAGLAQKLSLIIDTHAGRSVVFAPGATSRRLEGLDPETVVILQNAFEKAWRDLDYLTANPATQKALAARLIELLEQGERDPSRLATKAVLGLVAPKEAND